MSALLAASSTVRPDLGHFSAGKPECGEATRERRLAHLVSLSDLRRPSGQNIVFSFPLPSPSPSALYYHSNVSCLNQACLFF